MTDKTQTQGETFEMHPIGRIHRNETGIEVRIDEPYRPALAQLGQFSHVVVFWWVDWFDNAEYRDNPDLLQCQPPYAQEHVSGVFATRAPLGFSFFGDPFRLSGGWTQENEIGRLWARLMAFLGEHRSRIRHVTSWEVMVELHVEHPETPHTGEFEVFAGLQVERLEDVPVELTCKVLPAATYALFTLRGEQITSDWNKWMSEWMSNAGYRRAYPYGFQRYDERFKGMDRVADMSITPGCPSQATAPARPTSWSAMAGATTRPVRTRAKQRSMCRSTHWMRRGNLAFHVARPGHRTVLPPAGRQPTGTVKEKRACTLAQFKTSSTTCGPRATWHWSRSAT